MFYRLQVKLAISSLFTIRELIFDKQRCLPTTTTEPTFIHNRRQLFTNQRKNIFSLCYRLKVKDCFIKTCILITLISQIFQKTLLVARNVSVSASSFQ